jgi:hypothetical protein
MKSNNNNNDDDDDDDDDNTAMGSVHARGDTFLTFGLKALTETNTSRLATGYNAQCPQLGLESLSPHIADQYELFRPPAYSVLPPALH